MPLKVHTSFTPKGDQPEAIGALVEGLNDGLRFQTLLGATGTGKTFTMAKIIEEMQRPALILAPNKVLTAQLAAEFRDFFPDAAVEFFISYYDYYQPEAYVPSRDLFIEKDANINMELERLRHSTTRSLLTRRDVIVVASVSAIYGLGSPEEYQNLHLLVDVGKKLPRDEILATLVRQQYERNDVELAAGRFRARGDVIEVWAAYEEQPLRIELWGDEVDRITMIDPVTGDETAELDKATVFPAKHYVTPFEKLQPAIQQIEHDLAERLAFFKESGKLLEEQRLRERTNYDLEMLRTLGYCNGIENYSRYLEGRPPGSAPNTLLDYFPDDFITFLDESHVMLPQIRGMFNGDRARKQTLVDYGFRLPAALDNRPLTEEEFLAKVGQVVFVSATPTEREVGMSDQVAEQVIRPTGLVDPEVTVKPSRGQIDDLLFAARARAEKGERVLVTTLTKKMAEDLTEYLASQGVRVRYMHSDIDAVERQVIIRDLRLGHFDVLVGINLLREGLDLPEVSLVAILDADKTGFLRSERSLIQTIGRAARNVNGEVFLYADETSDAMQAAIDETNRRREKQLAYNELHGITPESVRKRVHDVIRGEDEEHAEAAPALDPWERELVFDDLRQELATLENEMWAASESLDFERAAAVRDRIREIEARLQGREVNLPQIPGQAPPSAQAAGKGRRRAPAAAKADA
ncbi:MAG: excinuclease ABC subunit UvrB [Deinococcales bacterium]|nr:excinuclease ABC subunit UvrB [Deinococcales bacterium]